MRKIAPIHITKEIDMKKILLVMFIVLFTAAPVFCGEFEDTLKKAEQGDAFAQYSLGNLYKYGLKGIKQNYEEAYKWYMKAAEKREDKNGFIFLGDPFSQHEIGNMYKYGLGVKQNYQEAFKWYMKAAEEIWGEDNTFAQFSLGLMYDDGLGIDQDKAQASYWYKKSAKNACLTMISINYGHILLKYKDSLLWLKNAAENGCASAQYDLGFMYFDGQGITQDYKKAIYWWKRAAEQGDTEAQFNLGKMHAKGQGVPQDYKHAIHWYKKAAAKGYAKAQNDLGLMYYDGQGVAQDYKQAAYWLTKAAEQGNSSGQYNLGVMYANGLGVTQNYKFAYLWFSLSAAQGDESAIKNRDITAKKLTPQQLSEAQDLAAKIQNQIDNPSETQPPAKTDIGKIIGSGTGFFITKDGHILTCHHVVEDAVRIEIYIGDKAHPASLVRSDPNNDLAILKINGSFPALAFSPHRSAKMGQDVFTVGYPNPGLQGVSAKYTKGTISSLTGFKDDLRLYQISIPVQPGNSGGALLDENGNILGIVVAMLSAKTTFQITGTLPQNVNYAVKSLYAQAMIDTMPEVAGMLLSPSRSKANAIDNAQESTVMVVCYD
jgi:hypothetical protein